MAWCVAASARLERVGAHNTNFNLVALHSVLLPLRVLQLALDTDAASLGDLRDDLSGLAECYAVDEVGVLLVAAVLCFPLLVVSEGELDGNAVRLRVSDEVADEVYAVHFFLRLSIRVSAKYTGAASTSTIMAPAQYNRVPTITTHGIPIRKSRTSVIRCFQSG